MMAERLEVGMKAMSTGFHVVATAISSQQPHATPHSPSIKSTPVPNGEIQRKLRHGLIRQSALSRAHGASRKSTGHDNHHRDADHRAAHPRRPSGCWPRQEQRRRVHPKRHGGEASGACFQEARGEPEEAKDASASKNANDTEEAKETPAPKKHAKNAAEAKKPPTSKKLTASTTKTKMKAKKTPASSKPTRRAKKVTASSKPAPKKPAGKKPAAKQLPKKKDTAKESPKTPKLPPKRTDVLLPGPHEEVSSESSDTDTPNPGYVSGADSPVADVPQAPRARAPTKDHAASANCAITSPQGRSPSPDPSLQVDYEESEPDVDHEAGEVERSPPRITDAQRVLHPGSPMSPKTVKAVARARALEASMSRRDDPPAAAPEPQVITNAGVDEGVHPQLLQPENRQHLAERSRQAASQAVGTKRDRQAHAPRTREQLLAL
ncbi:hypothetical protein PR001_g21634 [Phytophthora rubi]|uniref:Uncharacterized protein n=1 Tax=Phytophthora rubi TaxID=129364 RepID=A0A6A3JCR5_9STRA|nr:hypothetical protein PR001_g21634 [Phytophthora rubi]